MRDKPNFTLKKSAVLATLIGATLSAQAEEAANSTTTLPDVNVVGTTPLPGTGLPLEKYAGNVQIIDADLIEDQNAIDISETLFRNISSVDINTAQNNPYQNDVHYRGFLASPLVGTAIGISTYVDGVRVNEGFGDTVNWDLIPDFSISTISLVPGSNPLFGLNTLGGSLSLQTKDGNNFEGNQLSLTAGDFGRREITLEHGGNKNNFDWYLGGNLSRDDGWRVNSPSDVQQIFSKIGWSNTTTDVDLSYTFANNDLIGNGFVPESFLDADRSLVYTQPDQTQNEMHFVNLNASHWLTDNLLLAGNVFFRNFERNTLNGDAELECEDDDIHPANCEDEGEELEVEGEERRTFTDTNSRGGTIQLSHDNVIAGRENTLVFGASYDSNSTHFIIGEAEAELTADRKTINPDPLEIDVEVATKRENWSLFFTDTIDLRDNLAFTLSGRYQHSTIDIEDQTGAQPEVNGSHSFSRFNPAVGLTFNPVDNLTVYGSYNESFRTPTAAELTCADENAPCPLPNSFVADPPLDPVIGKTIEFGARGNLNALGSNMFWSAAIFRTELENDLLFTTTDTSGRGFFINVDETRRQGIELGLNGITNRLGWFINYSYIEATFESDETLASVVNPNGINVQKGDSVPTIPEHNIKLGASYDFTDQFRLSGNLTYSSSAYMRGDESNDLPEVDGYTIFNLSASYRPTDVVEIWAKVDNVFDTDYETSGIRNFNGFPLDGGEIEEERFLAPGAPRSAYIGVKVRF